MRRLFPIVLALLLTSCVASIPNRELECHDDSHTTANAIPPPDSDGPMIRMEGSYRRLDKPAYPQAALRDKVTGTVYFHVWVRADGHVSDVVIEHVHPRSAIALAEGLADRMRAWLFNPPEDYGVAVASEFIVPVKFGIKGYTPPSTTEPVPPLPVNARRLDTIVVEGE